MVGFLNLVNKNKKVIKKMVYKLIKEWKSPDPNYDCHEITVYKYNISHDEMIRYTREGNELMIRTTFSGSAEEYQTDTLIKLEA